MKSHWTYLAVWDIKLKISLKSNCKAPARGKKGMVQDH